MASKIQGLVRAGLAAVGSWADADIHLNEKQEQLVATGLPTFTEMVRKGNSWATMSTSAVAGLIIRPSTVAAFEIYNGNAVGGKSLIIDRMFWFNLVSTNVIEGFSGWACVTSPKAAVTSGSFVVRGSSGKAYPTAVPGGNAGNVIAAASTAILDSGWFPWGQATSKGAGGVVPFGAISVNVDGRLIVPPGCSLGMHVVSSLVGQTFTQGASWFEEQLTIE